MRKMIHPGSAVLDQPTEEGKDSNSIMNRDRDDQNHGNAVDPTPGKR